MSKKWNRTETWLTLIVLAVGVLVGGVFGLFMYMSATSTPLHPDARQAPSVALADPAQRWTDAVARAREVMRTALTAQNLPGVSVAVGVAGELVWAEGFGWADLDSQVPVAPDTRFRIGTASIALTSAAVGLLVEDGRLSLDLPARTYVPELPQNLPPVTLRQVLGHVAGIGTDGGDEGPLFTQHCERPVDALPYFAGRPLLFEPGTRYRFSNYGWIVVSAAVETAATQPFFAFMRQRIFDPLGMHDTRADPGARPIPDRATSYFPRFAADPRYGPDVMREIDLSCYAGAGAFLSTPSDLVRFAMAFNSGRLLQPATAQVLQSSQRLPQIGETGYGLGWDIETVTLAGRTTPVVGHDGEVLGGPVASFWTFPDGIVVAVTSNIPYADTPALALQVAEAFAAQKTAAQDR